MIYKLRPMFWDMNESTGLRHITLEHDGRVLFVVSSHRTGTEWNASALPMGYKMYMNEVLEFSAAFRVLPELMARLEEPDLSLQEIQDYLLTIQD